MEAQQFIGPIGNLTPDMFPDEDLPTRLDGYIAEAETRISDLPDPTQEDAMVTAWVYFRAYDARYAAMLSASSSTTLADQGSVSWTSAQMEAMRLLAARYRADFDDLFVVIPVVSGVPRVQPSTAAANRFTW